MKNSVALITGAGRGIGAATAEKLASEGCHLVLLARTSSQLEETRGIIAKKYPEIQVLSIPTDISQATQVQKAFDQTYKQFGRLDIVVNNAGAIRAKSFEDLSAEDWKICLDVNLMGTMYCCREAFVRMKNGGDIVNVSSLAGVQGLEKFPGFAAYSSAKFAVVGLSEVLSIEGKQKNIRVNCLCPGAVDTQMLREVLPDFKVSTQPKDIAEEIFKLLKSGKTGIVHALTNR